MEWVILFIANWILFFLFIDWKKIKYNIWCGATAMALQLGFDTNAISHDFYVINRPGVEILGSSLFFLLGPVLIIGIFIGQFHPLKKWLRITNVIVFAALYSIQEWLLIARGAVEYHRWDYIDSVLVNISAMIIISWVAVIVIEEKGTRWK